MKKEKAKKILTISSKFFSIQIIILLFCIATSFFHSESVSLKQCLIYFLFQFWSIFLPGFAIWLVMKGKNHMLMSMYTWSYAYGLILLVFQYFIIALGNFRMKGNILSVVISVISLGYIILNRNRITFDNEKSDIIAICIFVIALMFIGFLTVSLKNTLPNENGGNAYYVDFLFWQGNNISFTKNFPPQILRLPGEVLKYHYFSSIIIAQTNLITGIDVVLLGFYFSYIIPAILLVLSAYELFSTIIRNRVFIWTAIFIILFTEGTSVMYSLHMYFCPFGFDYGYIFGMLCISKLLWMQINQSDSLKNAMIIAVLLGMTTGCKGPVGAVILIGLAVYVIELFAQKKFRKGISFGIIWCATFFAVFIVFIGISYMGNVPSGISFIGIKEAWKLNVWEQNIHNEIIKYISDGFVSRSLSLLVYIYRFNRTVVFLIILSIICLGFQIRDRRRPFHLILLAICIWGIFLTLSTMQEGNSQMYFMMTVVPFGVLEGFYCIENYMSKTSNIYKMVWGLIVVLTFIGTNIFIFGDDYSPMYGNLLSRIEQGINSYLYTQENDDLYVSFEDYETYQWIKDNVENDAIIAIDCFYDENGFERNQIVSVFTEKYIWNDGKYCTNIEEVKRRNIIIRELLEGDENAIAELKKEGVSYFLQTVDMEYPLEQNRLIDCIYENENYKLYKIN